MPDTVKCLRNVQEGSSAILFWFNLKKKKHVHFSIDHRPMSRFGERLGRGRTRTVGIRMETSRKKTGGEKKKITFNIIVGD